MIKKYNPNKDDIIEKFEEIRKEINRLTREIEKIKRKTKESPKNIDYLNCPKCKSNKIIKRGFRYNLGRGKIQKYGCKSCGNKFSKANLDFYMRHSEVKISKAIKLFNEGFSYSQIAKKVGGNISRQTIGRWLKKYNVKKPKERIIEREVNNQYGTYKRKFLIKYK